jgi:poly(A) polymerase
MIELGNRLAAASPVVVAREALRDWEEDLWIVGGAVRDALLGRLVKDLDLVVAGDPERAARAVARAAGGPAFPLSEAYGAWRTLHPGRGWVCDVSPLQGASIEEDLSRRDFTVNAMAMPLRDGELIDPFGARRDLAERALRVVGGPELERSSYAADPLRPLRLARLAAETGLRPDAEAERLTRVAAPRVAEASPERVFAELRRLVVSGGVLEGLELADRLGLVEVVLPELHALHGVEQSHYHHLDVYEHTVEVLRQTLWLERSLGQVFGDLEPELSAELSQPLADELNRGEALRFAALLHDVGKPATRGVTDTGRVTFIGHDSVGADMIHALGRRLRTSERFRSFVADVTRHHLDLGFLVHERPLSRETVYRYLSACSPVEIEVTVFTCADRLATRGKNAEPAIAAHLELARELMADALRWRREGPPRAPVRGDELATALGLEPGPYLGRLLERLAEAAFTGEATTAEAAVELARRLRHNQRP